MTYDERQKFLDEIEDACQVLGKALGYPWYKDDQKNFPGTTEADGVCWGPETVVSLAIQAATKLASQSKLKKVLVNHNDIIDPDEFNEADHAELAERYTAVFLVLP